MGGPTPVEHMPVKLPSKAVGSFKLSAFSSSQQLVLTCIIEATIMQIREQISKMAKPVHTRNGTTKVSNSPAGEQGNRGGDGLSGVARVTLQAIEPKKN